MLSNISSHSRRFASVGLLLVLALIAHSLVFAPAAYAQNQTIWAQLPNIDSFTSPAVSGHSDGRVYVAAVAFNGLVAYTSTDSPGGWATWETLGPVPSLPFDQAFYANPNTRPIFARDGNTLYLFVRGKDDNLYETHKVGGGSWSSWQQLTFNGAVRGRLLVALTRQSGTLDVHVLYASESTTVEYQRFDSTWAQIGVTEHWRNALDGTIATDGVNKVWAVIRTNDRRVLIEKKNRPWTTPWQSVTSRLADGSQGEFIDISNAVYFAGALHVAYTIKYQCDDVFESYCHSLEHTRIRSGFPDDGYVRFIADYTPQNNNHPQAELVVYRNKLVMAYKDHQGWVRYARWDNADPTTPWIGTDIVDASRRTNHRPGLGVFDRRAFLTANDYANNNFGNDLFAAINEMTTNSFYSINFSRAIFIQDIEAQFAIYNSNSDNEQTVCKVQNDPLAPTLVTNPAQDGRPFFSELGYIIWTLPDWLSGSTFRDSARLGCQAGTNTSGRFDPPCDAVRYPVIIRSQGGIFICSGMWQTRRDDYKRIWEELGHSLSGSMGLSDTNTEPPTSTNATLTGIPLSTLLEAFNLFGQRVRGDQSCAAGAAPDGRCRGFTGIAGNYDAGSRQHSFLYVVYYYFSDGDRLRQWVQEDFQAGDDLLQQKYNWVKQHIFGGVEFKKDNEVTTILPPLSAISCGPGWERLNVHPDNAAVASNSELVRLHSDGTVCRLEHPGPTEQIVLLRRGGEVLRYDGVSWELIDDNPHTVEVAVTSSVIYQRHDNGFVWRHMGGFHNWALIDDHYDPAKRLAAAPFAIYQIRGNGHILRQTTFEPAPDTGWALLDDNPASSEISAGGAGLFQLHGANRHMWKYMGGGLRDWQLVDQNPQTGAITVGDDTVYQIHASGDIWRWHGPYWYSWTLLDDNGQSTAIVARDGKLYQMHDNGNVWRWLGGFRLWENLGGANTGAVAIFGSVGTLPVNNGS